MSDFNTISVLSIPYPDDPAQLGKFEWYALKTRLPAIADRIRVENLIAEELNSIAKSLWKYAHSTVVNGEQPAMTSASVVTENIVVSNTEIEQVIKKLNSLSEKLKQ